MRGSHPGVVLACVGAIAFVLVGCAGAPPPASQSSVTPAPSPTAGGPATAAATRVPTPSAAATTAPATPSPSPTAEVTASLATSPATSGSPDAVGLLTSYVHADLQATCAASERVYSTEVQSITCGPEDLPVDYTLFASLADMARAYNGDMARGETPPQPGGSCAQANYESSYSIDGQPAGRIHCRAHHSESGHLFNVIEWTNDELLVLGYISNNAELHSWQELIDFWQEQAGPFPPD